MIVHSLLRVPGQVVPGWFPLVVERVAPHLPSPRNPVEERVNGGRMLLDLDDDVQRKIWYRSFEPVTARALRRLLRPGDTALDVGANVGFYTLLFGSQVGPEGTVHAFEPVNGDALLVEVAGEAMDEPEAILVPLRAASLRTWRLGAFGGRRHPGPSFDARLTALYHLLALR